MRRILLLVTVAAMMASLMAVAGPAFATVHELANAECSPDTTPADDQSPPGLSGQSQGQPPNNFVGGTIATTHRTVHLITP